MLLSKYIPVEKFTEKPGQRIQLGKFDTAYKGKKLDKKMAETLLEESKIRLAALQDKLYAHNRYSVLIVLQAMDAAGKDGAVKHIMSGFNPQGVKVYPFKAPSSRELDHDYLWRHALATPAKGEIVIFNRSHYENVLVTRVHPEFILNESLVGIEDISHIDEKFWKKRYKQINRFEKNLSQNGTVILKFFLHLSKEEQKNRFLERIDDPSKNWKFSHADLKERSFWDDYQHAYSEALSATNKENAPWYIIPADDKWFSRLLIADVILMHLEKLPLKYPAVNSNQKKALQEAREMLINESKKPGKKAGSSE